MKSVNLIAIRIGALLLLCVLRLSVVACVMPADTTSVISSILDYYSKVPQERIYLQTDRSYYVAGDTVWFRAHLLDAVTRVPVSRSRYVYVELHDQQADTLMQRVMLRCDTDGVFSNAMILPRGMNGGVYTMVAYTQWMRNFGSEHFYYKPLTVVEKNGRALCVASGNEPPRLKTSNLLEVKQRKGQMLIRMLDDSRKDSLTCIIYGSGNLIEVPYVNSRVLRLDLHKLQPGIVTVAMLSKANEMIVAECETAIGAVYMPKVQMACKPERGSKAPVNLSIQLSDSTGIPLKGHYSVSVVDYDVVRADTLRSNLVDYINNHRDGKYPLADILQHRYPSLNYPMEHQQQITGCVRGTLKSKLKNPHLLLVNPIEGYRKEFELGDSSRFSLTVDSPENMIWLLEATRKNKSMSMVKLEIDAPTFPRVSLPHYLLTEEKKMLAYATQGQQQQMYNSSRIIELPEIEKTGSKPKIKPSNYSNLEANRNIFEGDPRIEHASSMESLLALLGIYCGVDEYGDKIIGGIGQKVGKIYVDNVVSDHKEVLQILPENVRNIEYFSMNNPQNTVFGISALFTVPGVLFIFLKDGSEVKRRSSLLSMAKVQPLGYRPEREFYSPQYPNSDKSDYTRPDYRTTLYWNPRVVVGDDGCASLQFYSSDVSKRYLVTIEGASDNGMLVSWQGVVGETNGSEK